MPFSSSRLYLDSSRTVKKPCPSAPLACIPEVASASAAHDSALDISGTPKSSAPVILLPPLPKVFVSPPPDNSPVSDESVQHSVVFNGDFPLAPIDDGKTQMNNFQLHVTRAYKLDFQDYIRCEFCIISPSSTPLEKLLVHIHGHIDRVSFLLPSTLSIGNGLQVEVDDEGNKILNGAICIPFERGFIPALYAALETSKGDTSLPDFSVDGTLVLNYQIDFDTSQIQQKRKSSRTHGSSFFLTFEATKSTKEYYNAFYLSPADCQRILYERKYVSDPF